MGSIAELLGPDFFLVGAPKCGTTAMNRYLAQHPEVGMCPRKESHYFAADLLDRMALRRRLSSRDLADYVELFESQQDCRRRGEASVWYLYSAAAPQRILEFCPGAEAIVMLRNPFEMLPSLHSEFVFVGIEPAEDFEQALSLDAERERSGAPKGFPPASYRSAIRYSEQLRRYLEAFGHDRVHVILFEDFRSDTPGCYRRTCEFLGVDPDFTPEIEVVNPNKQVRSSRLRSLVRTPPESLRPLLHSLTSQRLRHRVGVLLNRRLNTRETSRAPAGDAVVEALRPEVERQVEELRDLIGVEVGHWLDPAAEATPAAGRD